MEGQNNKFLQQKKKSAVTNNEKIALFEKKISII